MSFIFFLSFSDVKVDRPTRFLSPSCFWPICSRILSAVFNLSDNFFGIRSSRSFSEVTRSVSPLPAGGAGWGDLSLRGGERDATSTGHLRSEAPRAASRNLGGALPKPPCATSLSTSASSSARRPSGQVRAFSLRIQFCLLAGPAPAAASASSKRLLPLAPSARPSSHTSEAVPAMPFCGQVCSPRADSLVGHPWAASDAPLERASRVAPRSSAKLFLAMVPWAASPAACFWLAISARMLVMRLPREARLAEALRLPLRRRSTLDSTRPSCSASRRSTPASE
ncbi:unnamed protein product [Prorocentrum cordatum]|uniref:Uncharacterized protein n=1 Tax=Prorocentrum cordatum TaxID=2364126 RepID=A0ABN9UCJ6_9DINO|nr:unnamed protein product [Polarella glacialis]